MLQLEDGPPSPWTWGDHMGQGRDPENSVRAFSVGRDDFWLGSRPWAGRLTSTQVSTELSFRQVQNSCVGAQVGQKRRVPERKADSQQLRRSHGALAREPGPHSFISCGRTALWGQAA